MLEEIMVKSNTKPIFAFDFVTQFLCVKLLFTDINLKNLSAAAMTNTVSAVKTGNFNLISFINCAVFFLLHYINSQFEKKFLVILN